VPKTSHGWSPAPFGTKRKETHPNDDAYNHLLVDNLNPKTVAEKEADWNDELKALE
jgi:hypothetical protein